MGSKLFGVEHNYVVENFPTKSPSQRPLARARREEVIPIKKKKLNRNHAANHKELKQPN